MDHASWITRATFFEIAVKVLRIAMREPYFLHTYISTQGCLRSLKTTPAYTNSRISTLQGPLFWSRWLVHSCSLISIYCSPLILPYWTQLIILTCLALGSSHATALATFLKTDSTHTLLSIRKQSYESTHTDWFKIVFV